MIENRSAPPGTVVPILVYDDVAKAIEWLCGAFGFRERLRTPPDSDGTIHHAQLAVGEGAVILNGRPAGKGVEPRPKEFAQGIYVQVEDVNQHAESAKRFGARIVHQPRDCAFGERQYSAEDLAGNRWTFSQSLADADPKEWGAHVSEIRSRVALLPRPRLCYLEIPAVNVGESAAFYGQVFGWNIRGRESGRPSFDDATGHISGAWVTGRKISSEPGVLPSIWVDSIDAVLSRVIAHGGEVVEGPHPDHAGSSSRIARFRDPARNVIGLYQEG